MKKIFLSLLLLIGIPLFVHGSYDESIDVSEKHYRNSGYNIEYDNNGLIIRHDKKQLYSDGYSGNLGNDSYRDHAHILSIEYDGKMSVGRIRTLTRESYNISRNIFTEKEFTMMDLLGKNEGDEEHKDVFSTFDEIFNQMLNEKKKSESNKRLYIDGIGIDVAIDKVYT